MGFDVVTTAYGRPALQALADAVRQAKRGEPLATATVIVPANHVGVTARRLLATGIAGPLTSRGVGSIGVTFLTVHRLAETLGAPRLAAARRRPVSTPIITAALRSALHAEPGVFGPVAQHPATEEALVSAYRELADVTPPALDRLAAASPRAADVVRLCRTARSRLAARWYDESDLMATARSELGARGAALPGAVERLIVYLPQDLSHQAAGLLRDVAQAHPATVIAGLCGHDRADRGVSRSLARLGIDLDPTAASPWQEPSGQGRPGPPWPVKGSTTRIVTTSDPDDEVRIAVRAVIDAARAGTPLERVAILLPAAQPYARLVHEHLVAAGIPFNGTAVRSLAERTLGRTISNLLALRDRSYRRRDVIGLLTHAPLRSRDGASPPTTEWERLSREAAVVAGRFQWDRRLSDLAAAFDRQASELEAYGVVESDADADEERRQARVERYRRRADRVRDLHHLVLELIDSIEDAAERRRRWEARVRWLRGLLSRLLGGETARELWPDDERKAAERVDAALDRLAVLDQIDQPCTLEVFRRTLAQELDTDLGRVGRLGEGVLVAPLSHGIGLDLDLVVVLGAAEGTLPARPIDDSLLPDHERAVTGGQLSLRGEHAERQHRQLHAALSAAARHVLCAPRGDLRANPERAVSRWLAEMAELTQPADPTDATDAPGPIRLEHAPSFAYEVSHVAFPATTQEYRLRAGSAAPDDSILAAGRAVLAARQSRRFTRFDGNLAGVSLRSDGDGRLGTADETLWGGGAAVGADDIVSATRLEKWAECPHAYFMRYVLRVEPIDDPDELLFISPLEKGSLVHEVLERFFGAVLTRSDHERPGPDQPWSEDDHEELRRIANQVCAEYEARGVVGRELFWRRDRHRILARLDRFLREDDSRRRANRSWPVAAELPFGFPGANLPPVEVPIAGGRTLRFRGMADRVDGREDGALLVIDYKTGRPNDYRSLSEDNPDDRGTRLQLPVYALAARAHQNDPAAEPLNAVKAEYWFIGDRDSLLSVGYTVTDDVLRRVGATLATIVDGIAAGVFPARPTAMSSDPYIRCRYCDPDGLGVADRRRQWERKRQDPALAGYYQLAEASGSDDHHSEVTR